MSEIKIYIQPMNDEFEYLDFIDVTADVVESNLGSIKQETDFNEYDIGIFKFSNVSITLNNSSGKYSDVGQPKSIFRGTRNDSIIRISWQVANDLTQCGNTICGNSLTNLEVVVFEGLLADDSAGFSIENQEIKFRVLGFESLFEKTIFDGSAVANTDYLSDILKININKPAVTKILTYNALNINVGSDYVFNVESHFYQKKFSEVINELLFLTNSNLYIKDRTIYIEPNENDINYSYYFYGHTSDVGSENIVSMNEIKTGFTKLYNYLIYKNSENNVNREMQRLESVEYYGIKKKEFTYDSITNTTTIDSILDTILDEYSFPRTEISLTTILNYGTLELNFYDTVSIDYPTELYAEYGETMPIYGVDTYGNCRYPYGKWHYVILPIQKFKILNRTIDLKNNLITFKLREF